MCRGRDSYGCVCLCAGMCVEVGTPTAGGRPRGEECGRRRVRSTLTLSSPEEVRGPSFSTQMCVRPPGSSVGHLSTLFTHDTPL